MAQETSIETAPVAAVETPVETAPAAEQEVLAEAPAIEPKPSRAQERIRELIAERDAERTERERLQAEAETKRTVETPKREKPSDRLVAAPQSGHPALLGQEPDEDGDVTIGGRVLNAQDLIDRYEDRRQLNELRDLVQGDQKARHEAELDAKEASFRQGVWEAVEGRIAEMRETAFPQVTGDASSLIDADIQMRVRGPLAEAYAAGKLTLEFAEKTIQAAYEDAGRLFGIFGVKQFQDNLEYARTHKVKPGVAGEKAPVSPHAVTEKVRTNLATELAARVTRTLRGGG